MRCYVQIKDTDNASTEKITYLSNWAEFSASCKESNTVPVFILVPTFLTFTLLPLLRPTNQTMQIKAH